MPRMSSTCLNCGKIKQQGEFLENYCDDCMAAQEGARAAAVAEGRDPHEAMRLAREQRAHIAHRNFIDPRTWSKRAYWLNRPEAADGAPS